MKYYSVSRDLKDVISFSDPGKACEHVATLTPEELNIAEDIVGHLFVSTKCLGLVVHQEQLFETLVMDSNNEFEPIGQQKSPTVEHARLFHKQVVEGLKSGKHVSQLMFKEDGI